MDPSWDSYPMLSTEFPVCYPIMKGRITWLRQTFFVNYTIHLSIHHILIYFESFVYYIVLVAGIPTPLKNMKVSWGYYSQYMEKNKMFQTTNQSLF